MEFLLIFSYLLNRCQPVLLDGEMSDIGRITSRFLFYTADLLSKPKFESCVAYADDTYLLHHFSPQDTDEACLEITLKIFQYY